MPSPASTAPTESRLRPRDWILLPLIGLLTIAAVCAATELVARHLYTEFDAAAEQCRHFTDPYTGIQRNASCIYHRKYLDSEDAEYRLNSRGYRDDTEVTPKRPGVFRIVLVGPSYPFGAGVQSDQSIAGILPKLLSQQLGRKVELYNEALQGIPGLPQNLNRRFADVLEAQPDLVLWVYSRKDLEMVLVTDPALEDGAAAPADANLAAVMKSDTSRSRGLPRGVRVFLASLKQGFKNSRSSCLLQVLTSKSQSLLLKQALTGPSETNDFLRTNPSDAWRTRLHAFDETFAAISDKASAAHVPLAAALLPGAPQAAMISMGEWPEGYDPYLVPKEVDQIAARHGAIPLDVVSEFRVIPDPERDFFPVNQHPNVAGNAILAQILATKLESAGLIPRPQESTR